MVSAFATGVEVSNRMEAVVSGCVVHIFWALVVPCRSELLGYGRSLINYATKGFSET